jgi:hypothetical protein
MSSVCYKYYEYILPQFSNDDASSAAYIAVGVSYFLLIKYIQAAPTMRVFFNSKMVQKLNVVLKEIYENNY